MRVGCRGGAIAPLRVVRGAIAPPGSKGGAFGRGVRRGERSAILASSDCNTSGMLATTIVEV